jgi:hypothetical protein
VGTIEGLGQDLDENYERFIVEAIETGCVWGLENGEGWAMCPSVGSEEISVMPLWSQPEFAQVHCKEEWASYKPIPIALEELLDDWLPGMHGELVLVGINWDAALEGEEVEPLDVLEDVDQAAEHTES